MQALVLVLTRYSREGAALYSYIQAEQVRVPVFGVSPSSAVPSARATLKLASRVLRGGAAARIGCTIQCTRGGAGARRIGTRGQARTVQEARRQRQQQRNSRDGGCRATMLMPVQQVVACSASAVLPGRPGGALHPSPPLGYSGREYAAARPAAHIPCAV